MTLRRYERSDFEWSIIEPLLPNKPRGVPRSDDRKVLNGIYWRRRTGSPWPNSGALRTIDDLLQPFRPLGQDRRLAIGYSKRSQSYDGDLQMIDSSSIRVHQHGANGKKGGLKKRHPPLGTSLEPAAWGARARRTDHQDRMRSSTPTACRILLKLTAGQAHDGRSAADMLAGLGEGQILLADRGYDSDALRARLAEQGAWGNIKPMPHRVNVPSFSPYLYRFRNLVECFFNKLKHFRAVATR